MTARDGVSAMKMKETAEDIAVLERLWSATEREILSISDRLNGADSGVIAEGIVASARTRGYPVTVIRALARTKRMIARADLAAGKAQSPKDVKAAQHKAHALAARLRSELSEYQMKIGLSGLLK